MNAALAKLGLSALATTLSLPPQAAFPCLKANCGCQRTDQGLVQAEQMNHGWSLVQCLSPGGNLACCGLFFSGSSTTMESIYGKGPSEFDLSNPHGHLMQG